MLESKRPLKVFLYYMKNDLPAARTLHDRLVLSGVEVVFPGYAMLEIQTGEPGKKPRKTERKNEIQKAVQEADTVLFCLSQQFEKISTLNTEWEFVLDAAMKKLQIGSPIIPVRLEECDIPQFMGKWMPVNLFEQDGFERMMIALKLQAEMVKAELEPRANWMENFVVLEPEPELGGDEMRKFSPVMIVLFIILVILLIFLFRLLSSNSVRAKIIPVGVLAERATQNIQVEATNRAATVTAEIFSVSDPLTQTAVYRTSVPLTKTAVEFEAHITPTITLTPTVTLTPSPTWTVVSMPAQMIAAGNTSMVLVPGGSFIMGQDGDENASPAQSIELYPFYIDQYEVTNASYNMCIQAGICQPPASTDSHTHSNYHGAILYADFPILNMDWNMARTFCEWRGARLPSEAEWEKAARGADELNYPWGNEIFCPFANYTTAQGPCIGEVQPVDKYDAGKSIYNVYNMAGNVTEWVGSLYLPYPYDTSDDWNNLASDGPRVVRGGSWASPPNEVLTFHRMSMNPSAISVYGNDLGFRCASDANQ